MNTYNWGLEDGIYYAKNGSISYLIKFKNGLSGACIQLDISNHYGERSQFYKEWTSEYREATMDEKCWLGACILLEKRITKEDAIKRMREKYMEEQKEIYQIY